MKLIYDKSCSSHRFSEGDYVMLWWPYKVTGISHAFQPVWKGPYRITKIIGNTNCSIELGNGKCMNVHLNQLKRAEIRLLNDDGSVFETMDDSFPLDNSVGDLFDAISMDNSTDNTFINQNDRWCGLNFQNVLPARTRSGIVRVGDG